MTVKEKLHRLVEELPESEMLPAQRYLEFLRQRGEDSEDSYVCPHCGQHGHEPNEETRRSIADSQQGVGVEHYASAEELFEDLGL